MMTRWMKWAAMTVTLTVTSLATAGEFGDIIHGFLAGNPTNAWDVSAYGLRNLSANTASVAERWGAGARISYWLRPAIGAALDASYCDHAWTFASLALTARGSFWVGPVRVTPYAHTGPGWNINSDFSKTIVAVAGGGASFEWTGRKWPALFVEWNDVIADRDQKRLIWGITWRF